MTCNRGPYSQTPVTWSTSLLSSVALLAVLPLFACEKPSTPRESASSRTSAAATSAETGSAGPASLETALQPVILNADEYRQEITDIDRLAFDDQMGKERNALLAAKLEGLAQRIKTASDSRFIAVESVELQQLANMARNLSSDVSRAAFCNQWMRIRNNIFDDRSWFARSAADLEPSPAAPSPQLPKPEIPKSAGLAVDSVRNLRPLPSTSEMTSSAVTQPVSRPHVLEGRWRVQELYGNGRQMSDPELSNAVFRFEGDQLQIEGSASISSRYTFSQVKDDQGYALRLTSHPSNNGPQESGWMIYEFGERDLKLAFYDGLGYRPPSFIPPADRSDPLLMVVVLQSEP
jgi:uncharacterized protein (TIGR03067 family)